MATNLGSTGLTWQTTNMKPESGEQIDALWGQNTADNTAAAYHGYLNPLRTVGTTILGELNYFYLESYAEYNSTSRKDEVYFYKKDGLDTLLGTLIGTYSSEGISTYGTVTLLVGGGTAFVWGTHAGENTTRTRNESFSYDISGLTGDIMYKVTLVPEYEAPTAPGDIVTQDYRFGLFCTE